MLVCVISSSTIRYNISKSHSEYVCSSEFYMQYSCEIAQILTDSLQDEQGCILEIFIKGACSSDNLTIILASQISINIVPFVSQII